MYGIVDRLKLFPALLLSIIGAVPGIIVWTLVGALLDQFSSFVTALIPIGVFMSYQFFGALFCAETESRIGTVGCFFVCLPAVYAGAYCESAVTIFTTLRKTENALPLKECFLHLFELLKQYDMGSNFTISLIIGYASFLISYVYFVRDQKR